MDPYFDLSHPRATSNQPLLLSPACLCLHRRVRHLHSTSWSGQASHALRLLAVACGSFSCLLVSVLNAWQAVCKSLCRFMTIFQSRSEIFHRGSLSHTDVHETSFLISSLLLQHSFHAFDFVDDRQLFHFVKWSFWFYQLRTKPVCRLVGNTSTLR